MATTTAMKTEHVTVSHQEALQRLVSHLAAQGVWFQVEPLPNDEYEVYVTPQARHLLTCNPTKQSMPPRLNDADICQRLTSLLETMTWANAVDRDGYAGHESVYGKCREAVIEIVKVETGIDISNTDWNLCANDSYLEDIAVAVETEFAKSHPPLYKKTITIWSPSIEDADSVGNAAVRLLRNCEDAVVAAAGSDSVLIENPESDADFWAEVRESLADPPCEGCAGDGIRPNSPGDISSNGVEAPDGFVIVERCDSCDKFADDLAAATAWGTEARWFTAFDGIGGTVAIARPKVG